jgi:hypothetical protein
MASAQVDGIRRKVSPRLQEEVKDDVCRDEHIAFFQLFGEALHAFKRNIDHQIHILRRTSLCPSRYRQSAGHHVFDPRCF